MLKCPFRNCQGEIDLGARVGLGVLLEFLDVQIEEPAVEERLCSKKYIMCE